MAKQYQKLHWDTIIAFSDYLESNWHHWEKSNKNRYDATPTMGFDEVRNILKCGGDHQPSADRMARAELDLNKIPLGDLDIPQLAPAVAGHRVNMGAYLAGSPKSMVRFARQPQTNKSVRMYVDIAASYKINNKTLANRGAAILGAVHALQVAGYAVELTVGMAVKTQGRSYDEFHASIRVKDFGDTWNPAAVAFMLAEPAFFRRALWALINIEQVKDPDSVAAALGYGLGAPHPDADKSEYDIAFTALHSRDNWTSANSADKAMTEVYKWLETNKAGAAA